MSKGVFIHNPGTKYDDDPAIRYHFPKQYLGRVKETVGDNILFYQSGPKGGYTGAARVDKIIDDPNDVGGHYYAFMEPGSYVGFPEYVPFRLNGKIANSFLSNADGSSNRGRQVWAVRPISEEDFLKILALAANTKFELPRVDQSEFEVSEMKQSPFIFEMERPTLEVVLSKKVRSAMFRTRIIKAYDKQCAITGMRFINGGGRAEVDAAHIRAVKDKGTDSIRNGIALSKTVHWMFDRGLLAISDDYDILVSRKVNNRDEVDRIINSDRKIKLPKSEKDWPHIENLYWHREFHKFEAA